MNWKEKTVFITGADGFIGSHLAERISALGARTRALVYYNALGSRGWLDHCAQRETMEIIPGDIRDEAFISEAVRGADIVFHLAALIGIPYSYSAAGSYVDTNIRGTLHLLNAARAHGVQKFIHTSTSEVYGTARYVPIDEKHPLQAQSPYAATKIAADKLVESFHLSFGVPAVTVRPFNTYGPRQSARAVIPSILLQCLTDAPVRLGSLSPVRDFNYVADIVDGFIRAAEMPEAAGKTVHLGTGRETSIESLAQLIGKITGKDLKIECDEKRIRPETSEVERLNADPSLAKSLLGWQPKHSLEEGLKKTAAWFEKNTHLYRPGNYEV